MVFAAALLLCGQSFCFAQKSDNSKKKYAIVVSKATYENVQWAQVVNKLKSKYEGQVFTYDSPNIGAVRKQLNEYMPWYVCIVATPEEAGREFIRKSADLMRNLDDDPYEDAIWAVLTGYVAEDALRIASADNLTITNALSGVGNGLLDWFESGIAFNESKKNGKTVKEPGKPAVEVYGPDDTTEEIVQLLNTNKYQMMSSSGHATERNWQIGYNFENGYIVCKDGRLYGVSSDRKQYNVDTTNAKIYYSPGNCLIAHIPDRNCMALAWIHNGTNQFFGHIVPQGRQCIAWTIRELFMGLQDRFTYSEAVYLNQQSLIYEVNELKNNYPCCYESRKGTAFYGDPAWEARIKKVGTPIYDQSLTVTQQPDSDKYDIKFTITLNKDGQISGHQLHPGAFLPFNVKNAVVKKTDAKKAVVADNFIMLHVYDKGDAAFKKGDTRTVELVAERCDKWNFVEDTAAK